MSKKNSSMISDSVSDFRSQPGVPALDVGPQAVRPNNAFTAQDAFESDILSQK